MSLVSAPGRDELWRLLRRYNEYPHEREQIAAEIQRRFSRTVAVLAIDSSGFSRSVRRSGIVSFLALLERVERWIRPLVEQQQGTFLRAEADNFFAAFATVEQALACARAILAHLRTANEVLPSEEEFGVSIGIGYGEVLAVGEHDLYGDEMNLACKLGEDLAASGEVLLTPSAYAAIADAPRDHEQLAFSLAGVDLVAYRLKAGTL